MKILHLLSQNHLTGAEVYAVTLASAQLEKKCDVFQISNGFFYPSPLKQTQLDVETKSKLTFLKNIFWLRDFIFKNQIQIVHTHSRAAAKLGYWSTLFSPAVLVSTLHGQQHSSFSKRLWNQYGRFLIAVCENVRSHLLEDFKYPAQKIKVIRNPLQTKFFFYTPKKQNLPPNSPVKIGLIGRTTGPKKKRTEQVIQVLADLKLNVQIELVGGFKKDLHLDPSLLNSITEVQVDQLQSSHYSEYDLVIGSGRVCMESLLTGRPTFAFGEARYVGLIRESNFDEALRSNFGDIDLKSEGPELQASQFKSDLETLLRGDLGEAELLKLSEKAKSQFDLTEVEKKIRRLYESAIFLKKYPRWIPVLMYHKIPNEALNSQHKIFVTKNDFEKHLRFFKQTGFQTLTFKDLELFRTGQKEFRHFPRKPLMLTFDDGYQDNLDNASPLLKQHGFKAQIFLLADAKIKNNEWDQSQTEPAHDIVSETERQKWLNSAFEIGSHGFSHQKITTMTNEAAFTELSLSKKSLEDEFKVTVNTFAFTYGDTDERMIDLASSAGYHYAVNTDSGQFLIEENPYEIFRVNIFPNETEFSLWKKTSTWYRKYYFWKRKK